MTKQEVIALAFEAGFDEYQSYCLSGVGEDDRLCAVDEYPVGIIVLKFAESIEKKVIEDLLKNK